MNDEVIKTLSEAIRNLNAKIDKYAKLKTALQNWVAPTLLNSWANTGGAYQVAGYWKDTDGNVHLRGRVTGGAFPSVIFTLPTGYLPEATGSFTVPTGAVVDVAANGNVSAISGTTYVALDGVIVRAFA